MHPSRALTALLLVLAVAAPLQGCNRNPAPAEEARIRATIERYDAHLVEGYRTMDMNPLQEVATKLQAEDEYIHMSSLAEGGVRLLPELKSFELEKVSVEGTRALAQTMETWDYRHESLATKKIVLVQRGMVYRLTWDLERHSDGAWFVSDVRAVEASTTAQPQQVGTLTLTPAPVPPSGR